MTDAVWAYGQQFDTATNRYYEAGNSWDGGAVPNGTATFYLTKAPLVMLTTPVAVAAWNFLYIGYQFSILGGGVIFTGQGIIGGSGNSVTNYGTVSFTNSAAAGTISILNVGTGIINFTGSATADHAILNTTSSIHFNGESTAGNAIIAVGKTGSVVFDDNATAGDADITTAAEGAQSGQVTFSGSGPGNHHRLTAGSFAGTGIFDLGHNKVSVGSSLTDEEQTIVDGVIKGSGDSQLIKVGEGWMTLNGLNTYGATVVADGHLEVNGTIGKVTVGDGNSDHSATLLGNGRAGAVTIDDGYFSPGVQIFNPGLMRTGSLTLSRDGQIAADIRGVTPGDSSHGYDQIVVSGKVKVAGTLSLAQFGDLAPGQTLTIIDNDGKDKVEGTFSNGLFYGRIQEGGRQLSGSNVVSVSYKGGPGHNDVTVRSEGHYSIGLAGDDKVNGTSTSGGEFLHLSTKFADVFATFTGDDTVDAGAGADTVGGGPGKDVLNGGTGKDLVTFYDATGAVNVTLNGSKQVTVRIGGAAEDKIRNFEDVVGGNYKDKLTGDKGANFLGGGEGNDTVRGQAGNDVLLGSEGKDKLWGDSGRDTFVFQEIGAPDADRVMDFHHGEDHIMLDDYKFNLIGAKLDAAEFYAAPNAAKAHDKNDHIIYDTRSGELYFDADGKGGDGGVLFAILQGHPALSASDFVIG